MLLEASFLIAFLPDIRNYPETVFVVSLNGFEDCKLEERRALSWRPYGKSSHSRRRAVIK